MKKLIQLIPIVGAIYIVTRKGPVEWYVGSEYGDHHYGHFTASYQALCVVLLFFYLTSII